MIYHKYHPSFMGKDYIKYLRKSVQVPNRTGHLFGNNKFLLGQTETGQASAQPEPVIQGLYRKQGILNVLSTLAGNWIVSTSVCRASCSPPILSQPRSLGLCRLTSRRDTGINPRRAFWKSNVVKTNSV